MSRSRLPFALACLATSFLGGAAASLLFRPRAADAQEKKAEKVLKAQRFEIVDKDDKVIGCLGRYQPEDKPMLRLGEYPEIDGVALDRDGLSIARDIKNWVHIKYYTGASKYQMKFCEGNRVVWTQP